MLRAAAVVLVLCIASVVAASHQTAVQQQQEQQRSGPSLPSGSAKIGRRRALSQATVPVTIPGARLVDATTALLPAGRNASTSVNSSNLNSTAVPPAILGVDASELEARSSIQSQRANATAPLPVSLPAAAAVNISAALATQPSTSQLPAINSSRAVSGVNSSQLLSAPVGNYTTAPQQNTTILPVSTAAAVGSAIPTLPASSTRVSAVVAAPADTVSTSTTTSPLQSVWQSFTGAPPPSTVTADNLTSANTTVQSVLVPANSTVDAVPAVAKQSLPGSTADRHIVCYCQREGTPLGDGDGCDNCTRTAVKEQGVQGEVQVTILHFNDWHVRVEPTKEAYCALCSTWDVDQGRCSGGLARMATFVKQQRMLDPDLLLLNAGDDFIGTEWDRKAGVEAPAAFMNMLGVEVSTVGNHEWDKGLSTLEQYIDHLNNDVLGANIDFKGHELKSKIKPYVVKEVKGKKICIFGLTTQYGLPADRMGGVYIKEPYSYGSQVLKDMKGEGCHATLLLSHLGYTADIVAVKLLPGLTAVIGGHSHSFLWPDPNNPPAFYKHSGEFKHDSTWGPYPTMVWDNNRGREVPVVTASWGSRYMGKLTLTFQSADKGGGVKDVNSEVFLLGGPNSDEHVEQDQEALDVIKKWRTW